MTTVLDFSVFKRAIDAQFQKLVQHDLFVTVVDKDQLWDNYLASFPTGTNPMFRARTEHDCSCCRQFIRAVGNVVAIVGGRLESLWDVQIPDPAYQAVADSMARLVKSDRICGIFLHHERSVGTDKNFQTITTGSPPVASVATWHHFHAKIPDRSNRGRNFYCRGEDIATKLGEKRALHDVLERSLRELSIEAANTVVELIANGSLYRGNEHAHAVQAFIRLKTMYDELPVGDRDKFVWSQISQVPEAVAKIRNTSIGTLLTELSDGMELEDAVRRFEVMVAPQNYKRPTALVTKSMVENARKAVEELGLTSALERRYARLSDISVNDIIFADRSARKAMTGDVFDQVVTKASAPQDFKRVESMHIDRFISDVVPHVNQIEVLLENRHEGNLVSLIAPKDATARPLFKWNNRFSWAYKGDVADSIKERVKKAGGNVTADLCCRLSWSNYDDLDLHMVEEMRPRYEISFRSRGQKSPSGGDLDVDMNAGGRNSRTPVENIFYSNRANMREGRYYLFVNQFCQREADNSGFEVEIDYLGEVARFVYGKPVRQGQDITVVEFTYTHANGITIHSGLPNTSVSRDMWGLSSGQLHRVNVLMTSPNHWESEAGLGNKHWFFMLDGCARDDEARGFFNEFLRNDLDSFRKVMEMVGSKVKTGPAITQLSGIGFSDTRRAELLVRVKGNFTRNLKIMI